MALTVLPGLVQLQQPLRACYILPQADTVEGKAMQVSPAEPRHTRQTKLLDDLMIAAPQLVADGLNFHVAVAARLGLSLTDLRYLQGINAQGPATAGEIAARTGLTTGATTRMLDRLEQAGYLRRTRDSVDRRRVVIVAAPSAMTQVNAMYKGMATAWREALSGYSSEELEVILDLFHRMREISRREAQRIR